ncbi:DUF397 domain-containing protein [Streptomyces alboflavus]|uniref:DUF397 domain-containing protein n=1 Tax=Streptomyces alboflavus TaxID=67267 RepID=UPI0024AD8338|nr:DUF397 domain-containing protein [Streptomyces alboflavus]
MSVPVRDSKRPNGPVLDVHARAFADFVGGVKGGDFGNTASPSWFTSSYSDNGGQCIEVAANLVAAHGIVPVRDSKRPDGPVVHVRADAFSCFVNGLKGAS